MFKFSKNIKKFLGGVPPLINGKQFLPLPPFFLSAVKECFYSKTYKMESLDPVNAEGFEPPTN